MNLAICHHRRLPKPVQWLAIALPLWVIALGVLAIRPDWHAAMHVQTPDASHHDHGHPRNTGTDERGCAIQLFASGLVDSVDSFSLMVQPATASSLILLAPSERPSFASSHLEPPGRAPPSLS
jgi:hypothetical protein